MLCINLRKESSKILGIHILQNKKLLQEKKIKCYIVKTENVFKSWKMRDLSFEGKITIFKTLAISKLARHGLITSVPVFIIEQLNIIKQIFSKEKTLK